VRLLKEDLEEEASPDTDEAYFYGSWVLCRVNRIANDPDQHVLRSCPAAILEF
jgi:hypothetical protein